MSSISLDDIRKTVEHLANRINAPENLLPTYGRSRDGAHPHIEIDSSRALHFVVIERGEELERKTTKDLNELLYWIFDSITFSMSVDFELKHRIRTKDSRRIMFAKQEELLGILDISWQQKQHEEHKRIIKENPFVD